MRTFLLNNKGKPLIKWGLLKENTFYEGDIPDNYHLAINPHTPYIIVDVDRHSKDKNGFLNIPEELKEELEATLNYSTKRNGRHYWFFYNGDNTLMNKASNLGIDLRIGYTDNHNGGYVKWHPRNNMDIRDVLHQVNTTSIELNEWLESLFGYKNLK